MKNWIRFVPQNEELDPMAHDSVNAILAHIPAEFGNSRHGAISHHLTTRKTPSHFISHRKA
jgi:hypothetical protein